MAPELHENEKLDFPVDVYSFGITVWEVYTLEVPFNNISEFAFFRKVIDQERPKCPPTMNRDLVDPVSRCWAHNAEERPIFKDISLSIWTMVTSDEHGNHSPPLTSLELEARQQEGTARGGRCKQSSKIWKWKNKLKQRTKGLQICGKRRKRRYKSKLLMTRRLRNRRNKILAYSPVLEEPVICSQIWWSVLYIR